MKISSIRLPGFSIFVVFILFASTLSWGQEAIDTTPPTSRELRNKPNEREKLLNRIKLRMESVQGKIASMQKSTPGPSPVGLSSERKPSKPDNRIQPSSTPALKKDQGNPAIQPTVESSNKPQWSDNSNGLYFLPFAGFFYSSNVQWSTPTDILDLDQEYGYDAGVRMGYGWRNFYLELKVAHFKNEMSGEKIGSFTINGDFSSLSTLAAMGLKFPLTDHTSLSIGGGIGFTHQEAKFVSPTAKSYQDLSSNYFASTGFEFRPFEHLILGMHYHWYHMNDFSSGSPSVSFSDRDIHAIELSLGYFQ